MISCAYYIDTETDKGFSTPYEFLIDIILLSDLFLFLLVFIFFMSSFYFYFYV